MEEDNQRYYSEQNNRNYYRNNYRYPQKEYKMKRFAWVTWLLLIVCIIVYILEVQLSHSFNVSPQVMTAMGAVNSQLVEHGQLWRLFAAMWLHWSPEHIISNMLFLFLTGRQIEKVFGHMRFLAIYLFSGLVGDYFACFLSSPNTLSAGASTALFGIMLAGATLKWTVNERQYGTAMMQLFISNVVIDIFMPGISLVGHLGGAVAGFVLGFLLQPKNKTKWYTNLAIQVAICFLITAVLVR